MKVKTQFLLLSCIAFFTVSYSEEIQKQLDSLTVKTDTVSDADSLRNSAMGSLTASVDTIVKKLASIKNNVDWLSLSLVILSSGLKIKDEKGFKKETDVLDGLASYCITVSSNIPKITVRLKTIKTKMKISKDAEALLSLNDNIINVMDKMNEYCDALNLDEKTLSILGDEAKPLVELIKKYFKSCITQLEGLPDRIDAAIEKIY